MLRAERKVETDLERATEDGKAFQEEIEVQRKEERRRLVLAEGNWRECPERSEWVVREAAAEGSNACN